MPGPSCRVLSAIVEKGHVHNAGKMKDHLCFFPATSLHSINLDATSPLFRPIFHTLTLLDLFPSS